MKPTNIFQLIVCIAIPVAVGGVAGSITAPAIDGWYTTLNKPSFNPPNWLFAPVWTTLYVLMGVSFYMIWVHPQEKYKRRCMQVYALQLFLNFLWSIIFFALEKPDLALIEIVTLWVAILWMISLFRKIKPIAGYLQIPYLLWVSFATVLNFVIWWLNI